MVFIQKEGIIYGDEWILSGSPPDESFSGIELNFFLLEKLFEPGPFSFQGIPLVFKKSSDRMNETFSCPVSRESLSCSLAVKI